MAFSFRKFFTPSCLRPAALDGERTAGAPSFAAAAESTDPTPTAGARSDPPSSGKVRRRVTFSQQSQVCPIPARKCTLVESLEPLDLSQCRSEDTKTEEPHKKKKSSRRRCNLSADQRWALNRRHRDSGIVRRRYEQHMEERELRHEEQMERSRRRREVEEILRKPIGLPLEHETPLPRTSEDVVLPDPET